MLVIGRSKLAWDFAVTVHAINLFCCWMYEGFPKSFSWWLLQVTSVLLMVGLGTYTTRWKELRDTFFDDLIDPEMADTERMIAHSSSDDNNTNPTSGISMKSLK